MISKASNNNELPEDKHSSAPSSNEQLLDLVEKIISDTRFFFPEKNAEILQNELRRILFERLATDPYLKEKVARLSSDKKNPL